MKHLVLLFGFIILGQKSSIAQHVERTASRTDTSYLVIKQSWWWGWRMIHVDKPQKKLHKWHYDNKTNAYYRMKSAFGFGVFLK